MFLAHDLTPNAPAKASRPTGLGATQGTPHHEKAPTQTHKQRHTHTHRDTNTNMDTNTQHDNMHKRTSMLIEIPEQAANQRAITRDMSCVSWNVAKATDRGHVSRFAGGTKWLGIEQKQNGGKKHIKW